MIVEATSKYGAWATTPEEATGAGLFEACVEMYRGGFIFGASHKPHRFPTLEAAEDYLAETYPKRVTAAERNKAFSRVVIS